MSEKVLEQKVDKARPVPERGPPFLPSEAEIRVTLGEKTEGPKGICYLHQSVQFSSVQSLSHVRLFVTPRTAACQASLSITNSLSLLKLMSIEFVMPSSHLILCRPLIFLPSIFPASGSFQMSQFSHQVAKVLELQL